MRLYQNILGWGLLISLIGGGVAALVFIKVSQYNSAITEAAEFDVTCYSGGVVIHRGVSDGTPTGNTYRQKGNGREIRLPHDCIMERRDIQAPSADI